jgi:two-component system, NtrC family, nitrogen regulation sensor histidine kinase NtrY
MSTANPLQQLRYNFSLALAWRVVVLIAVAAALLWALHEQKYASAIVCAISLALAFMAVTRVVQRTNQELARLIEALKHGDFSGAYTSRVRGAGFDELARSMNGLIESLRDKHSQMRADLGRQQSLIEQVPLPLLVVRHPQQPELAQIELVNTAARRMFNRPHGRMLNDFGVYGTSFVTQLKDALLSGESSRTIRIAPADDSPQQLRLTQTNVQVMEGTSQASLRLIALQPIQQALDAVEMSVSRDLVRVLTHEIMNSLTPVTSLAQSSVQMAADLSTSVLNSEAQHDRVQLLQQAVETVARRADHLLQFVSRYRDATRVPALQCTRFAATEFANGLAPLLRSEWPQLQLHLHIDPAHEMYADRQQLEQVVINLLRNAAQMTATIHDPAACMVSLSIHKAFSAGSVITVEDNGPGVPAHLREEVFLPFYTTRKDGSGVGLALSKQIVLAHHGSICVESSVEGGALFRVIA